MTMKLLGYFSVLIFVSLTSKGLCLEESVDRGLLKTIYDDAKSTISSAKAKFEAMVDVAVNLLKVNIKQIQTVRDTITEAIANQVISVNRQVDQYFRDTIDEMDKELAELEDASAEKGVDLEDCKKLPYSLIQAALRIVAESHDCLTEKIHDGYSLIDKIYNTTDNAINDMLQIIDDANVCMKNVNGILATVPATACFVKQQAKASWIAVKTIPPLTKHWTYVYGLVGTLPASLGLCTFQKSFSQIREELVDVLPNVRKCRQEKLDF